jgi:hypothetical protein
MLLWRWHDRSVPWGVHIPVASARCFETLTPREKKSQGTDFEWCESAFKLSVCRADIERALT